MIKALIEFHTRWFNAETRVARFGPSLALVVIGICLPCAILILLLILVNRYIISLSPNQNFFLVCALCCIWIFALMRHVYLDLRIKDQREKDEG